MAKLLVVFDKYDLGLTITKWSVPTADQINSIRNSPTKFDQLL